MPQPPPQLRLTEVNDGRAADITFLKGHLSRLASIVIMDDLHSNPVYLFSFSISFSETCILNQECLINFVVVVVVVAALPLHPDIQYLIRVTQEESHSSGTSVEFYTHVTLLSTLMSQR